MRKYGINHFLRKGAVRHGIYFEGSEREKRLRNADVDYSNGNPFLVNLHSGAFNKPQYHIYLGNT